MSRDQGFPRADIDTGMLTDPKVKALWRLLRDETAMNAAAVLYQAVIYESWGAGERLTAEDSAPAWLSDIETPTDALQQADLLDPDGRIPAHA